MFERGCRGKADSSLEFLYKLPAIQGVEKVYVARFAIDNVDRQCAFFYKNARRLLIGVAPVFES